MKLPTITSPSTIRRLAFFFVLFLMTFEVYVIRVNYAEYFAYVVDSENVFFTVVTLACLLASFVLFFYFINFAFSTSWFYKALCFLLFALSVIGEYGYQKALGRFTGKMDIETAIATTAEQKLASVLMYVNLFALIPICAFLILLIFIRTEKKLGLKHFLLWNLLFAVLFVTCPILIDQKFPTLATAAFYRTNTEFLYQGPITNRVLASSLMGNGTGRRSVKKPPLADDFRPPNNVVVVVDESVRADHLSINGYSRATTPFLEKLLRQGILTNWGIAVSASTGSRYTYNALITGLKPEDFPDKTGVKLNTFPSVFQYAKAMNYKTYFFDGQMNGYWGGAGDDKKWLDFWEGPVQVSERLAFESWDLDKLIAKKVGGIISSSTGNFIFIFKRGSHIPYQNNFPADEEIWQPSYKTTNKFDIPSGDDLQAVANAYDNSLRYNIDSFFLNMIDDYANIPNNSMIIYTGDHGQSLFMNGRAAHGGSTKEEATVPLFIIGKLNSAVDTRYRASHQNLFPTILDLIGYPAELRDWSATPSLLKARAADSKQRFFNPDLGEKVAFD